ncbi:MAG: hypothetical protein IT430_14500 [Phycisphaerales bacterium]|nr:hypothetical protein [Phycisphaerales bacterium]
MPSPHEQPRLLLLGSPGEPPAPRPSRSRPGRVRRAVSYTFNSMRTQPLLTLGVAAFCVIAGLTHLWASQPYWVLTPEYRIGSLENDPSPSQLRVEIDASELRDLLISEPIVREVTQELATMDDEPGVVAGGPWRQAGTGAWRWMRSLPRRAAAAAGIGGAEESSEPAPLIVSAPRGDETGGVVRIEVRATSPRFAELAPSLLLDRVRNLLLREERSRTLGRAEELKPLRDDAASRWSDASAAVADYRLEIGRHDPAESAREIQSRLIKTRGDRADLETDLREAEANRIDITAKMQQAQVEQTTRVVVEQNQRVQQLKNEISTLESKYAADLAVKTPKHQDMVRLRLEIESKKRDLNNEELLVIREKVQEPSMEYVGLLERQAQNNRQLVTLAGRELGLAETESLLQSQLVEAMKMAQHMEGLLSARTAAEASLRQVEDELSRLEARLTSVALFSQVTLWGRAKVADPTTPDEPNAPLHLLVTALVAGVLAMAVPVARSLARARLVAPWQIEQMAETLPVQLVGELPGATQRLLARLPGGEGR